MLGDQGHIVAVGLLTQADLDRLGGSFSRSYPICDTPSIGDLLWDIDQADRAMRHARSTANHKLPAGRV